MNEAKQLLFCGYVIDLCWLMMAFIYGFTVIISNIEGKPINTSLTGVRAWLTILVIGSWFYYVLSDAVASWSWLQIDHTITIEQIKDKSFREWLSVLTSILTTLLIAGCRFGQKRHYHENR